MNNSALIFDINAKFASFRKIDSNSSSLTYRFPPRTTIMGIIAAIFGIEKDSYYELFHNSEIAVKILKPARTIFQSVNNIKIKNKSELNFLEKGVDENHTIIPTELLIPIEFSKNLEFRVYFSDEDMNLFEGLLSKLNSGETEFPISLGYANMLSHVKIVGKGELSEFEYEKSYVQIVTPIPMDMIDSLEVKTKESDESLRILKDLVPYSVDKERYFKNKVYVFEESGVPMNVKLKKTKGVFSVLYYHKGNLNSENICFL
ncbi:CRISPR-associated crRNA-binding protein Cas5 [Cuniculiplasma divulgatum]|jgi:CRISPR-associated protein Cas5h|uniref:CRISPR-associated crRNA-binding protein Cas5 n=1 Tax=Cuniculiplasma divulgatum TaxID=1673428 RepID=A0A1R4A8U8_9ARCH|nr:CRISPR-associated crRNA-binding protein Cas5 [Cuniculiplasma divulgatum]